MPVKKGAFVLCMILLVQLTVFNVYSDDYDFRNNKAVYADAIETLKTLNICTDETQFGSKLTRRDCLIYLYRTMTVGIGNKTELDDDELIAFASKNRLLTDSEAEVFELDKIIPWRESITLTERVLVSLAGERMYPESFSGNAWYDFAEDILLCSYMGSGIDGMGAAYIPLDCADNDTELYEFFEVLYVALHIPHINRETGKCSSVIGMHLNLPDEPYQVSEKVLDIDLSADYSRHLTRGEVLSLLLKCTDQIAYGSSFNVFNDEFKSAESGNIAECAYRNGLLSGKIGADGMLYAALDDLATWQEAVTFADKLVFENYTHNDYIDLEWSKFGRDEAWLGLAKNLGIANNDDGFFTRSIDIKTEKGCEPVIARDFLCFMYSVVHSPAAYSDYYPGYSWFRIMRNEDK